MSVEDRIEQAVRDGASGWKELAAKAGVPVSAAEVAVYRMAQSGRLRVEGTGSGAHVSPGR